jgi:hypothetical protein
VVLYRDLRAHLAVGHARTRARTAIARSPGRAAARRAACNRHCYPVGRGKRVLSVMAMRLHAECLLRLTTQW